MAAWSKWRPRSETVSTVHTDDAVMLARAGYHLGNRHVALQIGGGWLRYQHDHVLDDMLRGFGLDVRVDEAPFEPEGGAYVAAAAARARSFARLSRPAPRTLRERHRRSCCACCTWRVRRCRSAPFIFRKAWSTRSERGWVKDEASALEWIGGTRVRKPRDARPAGAAAPAGRMAAR